MVLKGLVFGLSVSVAKLTIKSSCYHKKIEKLYQQNFTRSEKKWYERSNGRCNYPLENQCRHLTQKLWFAFTV